MGQAWEYPTDELGMRCGMRQMEASVGGLVVGGLEVGLAGQRAWKLGIKLVGVVVVGVVEWAVLLAG